MAEAELEMLHCVSSRHTQKMLAVGIVCNVLGSLVPGDEDKQREEQGVNAMRSVSLNALGDLWLILFMELETHDGYHSRSVGMEYLLQFLIHRLGCAHSQTLEVHNTALLPRSSSYSCDLSSKKRCSLPGKLV